MPTKFNLYDKYYLFCLNPTVVTFTNFLNSLKIIHQKLKIKGDINIIVQNLKDKHIIKKKLSITMRPSPVLSATCFPEGYLLFNVLDKNAPSSVKPVDNITYWIAVDIGGTRKWIPFVNKYGMNLNNQIKDGLVKFIIPEIQKKNFEKISDIYIGKKLLIGETLAYNTPVTSGIYSVYRYMDCCILCPKNSFDKVFSGFYVDFKKSANVSEGSYGFYNGEFYDKLNTIYNLETKTIPSQSLWGESIHFIPMWVSNTDTERIITTKKIIEQINFEHIKNPILANKISKQIIKYKHNPVGILIANGTGDGGFPIFHIKKDRIYIILSDAFLLDIYEEVEHFFS